MKILYIVVIAMFTSLMVFADGAAMNQLPGSEVVAIKAFLREFADAVNSNDANRIKRMSGRAWKHFRDKIDCKEKTEGFDIVKISTDGVTNIITRAHVVDTKGKPYSVEVVFDLKKVDGVYSIDKMRLPESERRHEEFETADRNFEKLITAIKGKDIGKVKEALPFGDVADFDAELSARGLSWIMDAANSDVVISGGWGVRRSGKDGFVGHVEISSKLGGTNVLHEVMFKGLQIDHAAPPKLDRAERLRLIKERRAAARKLREAREAAEQKKMEGQFWERLRKQKKRDGEGAK